MCTKPGTPCLGNMEYQGCILILLTVATSVSTLPGCSTSKVGYLVEGPLLTYGSQMNISSIQVNIDANYNQETVDKFKDRLAQLIIEWSTYPPFVTDPALGAAYTKLMHRGFTNLKIAHRHMSQILGYVQSPEVFQQNDHCNYTLPSHTTDDFEISYSNLKLAWDKVGKSWTADTI